MDSPAPGGIALRLGWIVLRWIVLRWIVLRVGLGRGCEDEGCSGERGGCEKVAGYTTRWALDLHMVPSGGGLASRPLDEGLRVCTDEFRPGFFPGPGLS